jgi:hypothetical protein
MQEWREINLDKRSLISVINANIDQETKKSKHTTPLSIMQFRKQPKKLKKEKYFVFFSYKDKNDFN